MIAYNLTHSDNTYIERLERLLKNYPEGPEWLIVADSNPQAINRLKDALHGQTAVYLIVTQACWQDDASELAEALEWALKMAQPKNLLFVGSSDRFSYDRARRGDQALDRNQETGSFLRSHHQAQLRRQQAQQEFAQNVCYFYDLPGVHEHLSAANVSINGLFYRTESGVFAEFNLNTGKFRELIG